MLERAPARLRAYAAASWFDPALAAVLACVCLLELLLRFGTAASPAAALAAVLACAPLALRRRHTLVAACAQAAVVPASAGVSAATSDLTGLAVLVLAYSCGAHLPWRAGALGVGVLLAALQVAVGLPRDEFVPIFLGTLGPFWAGWQVRRRRALVDALAARARELEAEEDAFARLAVRRERARIARELHDIVAHHLAVIVIQAGAGRMAAPGHNGHVAERFATIRQSGDQALAETARLLEVLHADEAKGGLRKRELGLLLDKAGAAGLAVNVTPLDADVRLPAAVEESAYRIVQEGLTNAIKHAPGAEVSVRLAVRDDDLEIEVSDAGAATSSSLAPTGSSLGLIGMRERVESFGGSLAAGPRPGAGWCLRARLPLATAGVTPAR